MKTENEKLGSESAFPISETKQTESIELRMSKRLYAAVAVAQGLLANPNTAGQIRAEYGEVTAECARKVVVATAYGIADELLKQENQ
jgi:hypothetical protein